MVTMDYKKASATSFLIVPAGLHDKTNQQVSFLFSYIQIEELLRETEVTELPFSPSYVEGITVWSDRIIPVISLERLIGKSEIIMDRDARGIVIKTRQQSEASDNRHHALIRISRESRLLNEMPDCEPLNVSDFVAPDKTCMVPGVYQWQDTLLMVADMSEILSGIYR